MKGFSTSAIKKVTLELVYQVVDERTKEIITAIEDIRKKQEDDFRYLVQKIDNDVGQLRTEVKDDIKRLDGKIDQLNQRIDTVIQMLMTISQRLK